ncbi:hypothetical protein GCM10011497_36860 [Elstera cyanobacteriorum]|nr:hypothetical protein GCM10011497_36860 [Elstera cyanobacteriorum]
MAAQIVKPVGHKDNRIRAAIGFASGECERPASKSFAQLHHSLSIGQGINAQDVIPRPCKMRRRDPASLIRKPRRSTDKGRKIIMTRPPPATGPFEATGGQAKSGGLELMAPSAAKREDLGGVGGQGYRDGGAAQQDERRVSFIRDPRGNRKPPAVGKRERLFPSDPGRGQRNLRLGAGLG